MTWTLPSMCHDVINPANNGGHRSRQESSDDLLLGTSCCCSFSPGVWEETFRMYLLVWMQPTFSSLSWTAFTAVFARCCGPSSSLAHSRFESNSGPDTHGEMFPDLSLFVYCNLVMSSVLNRCMFTRHADTS